MIRRVLLGIIIFCSCASAAMMVESGATDVTTYFVIRTTSDGTATTGATVTDIDLQYCEQGAAPSAKVDATALGAVDAAHSDNKAIEVGSTDQPGLYRVDWPDAAFDGGVGKPCRDRGPLAKVAGAHQGGDQHARKHIRRRLRVERDARMNRGRLPEGQSTSASG